MSAGRRVALLLLALLLALAVTDCRAQRRGRGRCRSHGLNKYFKNNDDWTEPGCRRARCRRGRVLLDDCPPLPDVLPPGCRRRDGPADLPFPDCCPALECRPPDDRCYVPELDQHFAVGETWTLPGCSQAKCEEGGAVSAKGCGGLAVPPGYPCSLDDGDDSLEYPQCCPKVTCRECYSEKTGRFFGPGDSWTGSGCTKIKCNVDDATQSVSISAVACPLEALPFPDCELADGPAELDYPDCCPTMRCPGRCFSAALGRWFSVGDEWTEEGCTRARCTGTDEVTRLPCGRIGVGPNCRVVEGDATAEYPACCPTVQCAEPDRPCYAEELGRFVAVGETWTDRPGCGQATCREGGAVSGKGCGLVAVPPGYPCSLDDGDDSLEYPQCCPKVTCRECYSEKSGRFFGPGDSWTGPGCNKIKCNVDDATQSVSISAVACPTMARPFPDCELADGPAEADYPACCPTMRCPGRCFSAALDRWFSVGDEWTEEGCTRARCTGTDQASLLPCGLIAVEPNCRVVEGDATAEYPACCPTVQCAEPDRACYAEELDQHFAVGETWTVPGCGRATCREGGEVYLKGCGPMAVPPGYPCSLDDGDNSLEYPQCCPKVTCRECYSEKSGRFFGPGDSWTGPGCTKIKCNVDDATQSVSISAKACPTMARPFPDCELADGPAEADYPACCPTMRCPGRCFSAALGRWFSVGDEWTEEGCTRARCTGTDQVSLLPCGLIAVEPNCRVVEGDATAEYPACCATVRCAEPDRPCYAEELDQHFAVGESWTIPGCGRATCREGGEVYLKGCGPMALPPGYPCSLDDGDNSLEYPQCCPKVTCRECYSEKTGRFFGPGDSWSGPGCTKIKCNVDDATQSVSISAVACPTMARPFPDCELADGPAELDYPDCCPTMRCPGRCFSAALGRWFSVGDEWTEEGCTRARCTGTDQVSQLPCGLIALPRSDCEISEPSSSEYPDCCPMPRCPGACYSRRHGQLFPVGSSWAEPGCTSAICDDTNDVVIQQCPEIVDVHPSCTIVEGPGDTFPDCCPFVSCRYPY